MALVDRRVEELQSINERALAAQSFLETLELTQAGHVLALELLAAQQQVERIARGWAYIPPPRCC